MSDIFVAHCMKCKLLFICSSFTVVTSSEIINDLSINEYLTVRKA